MAKVRKRIVRAGIACVVLAFGVMWGRFGYYSVCTTCGAEQRATDWQLPMMNVTYWHSHSVSETPLSRVIARDGLVSPHEHTWVFAHGGGNGVTCAIGPGRWVNVASPRAAEFVDAVTRYRGVKEGRQWAALFLVAKPGGPPTYLTSDMPREGFPTKEGFDMWWDTHLMEIEWALNSPASEMSAGTP